MARIVTPLRVVGFNKRSWQLLLMNEIYDGKRYIFIQDSAYGYRPNNQGNWRDKAIVLEKPNFDLKDEQMYLCDNFIFQASMTLGRPNTEWIDTDGNSFTVLPSVSYTIMEKLFAGELQMRRMRGKRYIVGNWTFTKKGSALSVIPYTKPKSSKNKQ